MTTPLKAAVCDASVFMYDRRAAGVWLSCQLSAEHTGFHSHTMTDCLPPAELTWWTE